MFKIDENRNIHLNRGDQMIIKLRNSSSNFTPTDRFKFSIMKKGNAGMVLFQKEFVVEEESNEFTMVFTPEETRLGDVIRTGTVTYWYEIEYNGMNTVLGYDTEGPKEFILYPEAVREDERGD